MLRKLFTFNGGVKPDYHKEESTGLPIAPAPLSKELVIPLHQSVGGTPRPLVAAGDQVLKGQMIGAAEGYVSTAVHAPTSGTVLAGEPRAVPHPSGLFDLCVAIESDGEDRGVDFEPLDWRNLDPSALRNRIRDLGLAAIAATARYGSGPARVQAGQWLVEYAERLEARTPPQAGDAEAARERVRAAILAATADLDEVANTA